MLKYTTPTVIRLGLIEEMTGALTRRQRDVLGKGNLL